MKQAKQSRKFWERAFIITLALTLLISALALGSFLIYEGNSPKLKYNYDIIQQNKNLNGIVEPNNYTVIEIINWTQSQEVMNGSAFLGFYDIIIFYYFSDSDLNIYFINNITFIELNLTKNITKITNLISTEDQYKLENKSNISNLELRIITSKRDTYYFIFENKNNKSVRFEMKVNAPKIIVDKNEKEIEKYSNENRYLKNISDMSIIVLIFLFFVTIYTAYRWLKESV